VNTTIPPKSCVLRIVLAGLLGVLVLGCAPKPTQPRSYARPEPIRLDQLDELIDSSTQFLARYLPTVPAVRDSEYQQVLMIGPIEDETFSDRSRFEAAMKSIVTRLQDNRVITNAFVVLTTTQSDPQELLKPITGASGNFDDPFGASNDTSRPAQYKPDSIYLLTGKFYQHTQGALRSYRLFVEVDHAQSRQTILSHEFRRDLQWDSQEDQWIVQASKKK